MAYREISKDTGECRKIEVIAAPAGWIVTEEGLLRGSFGNIEDAYLEALSICATLFDQGTPARVFEAGPYAAQSPSASRRAS